MLPKTNELAFNKKRARSFFLLFYHSPIAVQLDKNDPRINDSRTRRSNSSRTRKMRDWSHTHREPRVDARWSSWLLTWSKDRAGTRQVRYFWSFVEPDGARARVQHTEARLAHLTHELDERLVFGGLDTKSRRAESEDDTRARRQSDFARASFERETSSHLGHVRVSVERVHRYTDRRWRRT